MRNWSLLASNAALVVAASSAAAQTPGSPSTAQPPAPTAAASRAPQRPVQIKDEHRRMSQARISGDSAQRIALARVPGGTVSSGELDDEDGRLVYDIKVLESGKRGVSEVEINAMTGAVRKVERSRGVAGRLQRHQEMEKQDDARAEAAEKKSPAARSRRP